MVKVAIISYLNTLPFAYGLKNHSISKQLEIVVCTPAEGARLLKNNKVDLGIIPVAAIGEISGCKIISNFCIGADKGVESVLLCSGQALPDITEIFADSESMTSVMLSKILCRDYWGISPDYKNFIYCGSADLDYLKTYVLIGDKALKEGANFNYVYDLAQEWINFRGKPFVFACWVANKELSEDFIASFNEAIEYGVANIANALKEETYGFSYDYAYNYLTNHISYNFDNNKKEGLQDFWSLAPEELKSKVRWCVL